MTVPLPYERFTIETELSPEEVAQRLRDVTDPGRLFRIRPNKSKEFLGSVGDREFQIIRNIRYRNSFVPVVHGRVEETSTGTSVQVSMKLHPFVLAFMALWFGGVTIFLIAIVAITAVKQTFTPLVFAPLGFYAFGYALTTGGFKFESSRSRRRIEELLRAETTADVLRRDYSPDWPLKIRWSDIRAAGPIGLLWVAGYAVAGALALYDWIIRRAGCSNQEAHDPSYICPSGARVFSVWAVLAATVVVSMLGIWPVRWRRPGLLVPIIVTQVVAIVVLAWIARNPAFHVRHR